MILRFRQIVLIIVLLITISAIPVKADNFLRVYATKSGTQDTVGIAEHFLIFGTRIPVFIPPYTLHITVNPLNDDKYKAEVDCYELPPDYKNYHYVNEIGLEQWQTIDGLEAKGLAFDYHYVIFKDTVEYFDYLPKDSLTNFESVHFKSWLWRGSYADYKWEMRKGYLENIYNFYRKEHKVKRGGKIDFYVYPGGYNSPYINNLTGVGYDLPSASMYAIFNDGFDSALPQHTQLFVIYENLGYSARSLAVGYSRYFLDDMYRARAIVKEMSTEQIKSILTSEYPKDRGTADIICGAFAKYLVDLSGVSAFKSLYNKSKPGYIATDEAYDLNFDRVVTMFIEHLANLHLSESQASYMSSLYNSQMWFDQALEYDSWLGSQPVKKDYHLTGLGATLFYLGDYKESQKVYASLNKRNPDKNMPKYLFGLSLLRTGKTKQAMRYFEQAADSIPEAAMMLGEIYLNQRDVKKAEEIIMTVPEYPDSRTSLLKGRLAIAKGNHSLGGSILKKSLQQSKAVTSASPGEARGYITAGYGFMFDGKFAEAKSELEVALFIDNRPYYIGATYLALGRMYDLQGERDKAREYYSRVIENNSGEYNIDLAKKYLKKPFELK